MHELMWGTPWVYALLVSRLREVYTSSSHKYWLSVLKYSKELWSHCVLHCLQILYQEENFIRLNEIDNIRCYNHSSSRSSRNNDGIMSSGIPVHTQGTQYAASAPPGTVCTNGHGGFLVTSGRTRGTVGGGSFSASGNVAGSGGGSLSGTTCQTANCPPSGTIITNCVGSPEFKTAEVQHLVIELDN